MLCASRWPCRVTTTCYLAAALFLTHITIYIAAAPFASFHCPTSQTTSPLDSQHEGSQSNSQSQVEKETAKHLEEIEAQYKKNKDDVVNKLLDRVVQVKMEMHRNAAKVQ